MRPATSVLAHAQPRAHTRVGRFVHPGRALGALPFHQPIAPAQPLAAPKIGDLALVLARHQIAATFDQQCDGEVVALVAIYQNHVARLQVWHQGAKQRLCPGMFAAAWSEGLAACRTWGDESESRCSPSPTGC